MIDNSKEYIVCAAIWYEGGNMVHLPLNIHHGIVVCGLGHNVFEILTRLYPDYKQDQNTHQGFVTSKRRFVERDEALKIAHSSGQIDDDTAKNKWLYSEDLY